MRGICEGFIGSFGAWVGNHLGTRRTAGETVLVSRADGFVAVSGKWEPAPSPMSIVVPVLLTPALSVAQETVSSVPQELQAAATSGMWGGALIGGLFGVISGFQPRYREEGVFLPMRVKIERSPGVVVSDIIVDTILNGVVGFALSVGVSYGAAWLKTLGVPLLTLPFSAGLGGAVEARIVRALGVYQRLDPKFGAWIGFATGVAVAWF